jgi:hypothetical protein
MADPYFGAMAKELTAEGLSLPDMLRRAYSAALEEALRAVDDDGDQRYGWWYADRVRDLRLADPT